MDEAQFFLTAISTVGFPIAACIAMFWLYNKIVSNMLPIVTQLSQNMKDTKDTMDEVKVSLNLFNQNFNEIFKRLAVLESEKKN